MSLQGGKQLSPVVGIPNPAVVSPTSGTTQASFTSWSCASQKSDGNSRRLEASGPVEISAKEGVIIWESLKSKLKGIFLV